MASKDAGFTLVETMVVLAILALSLTLGLPALGATLERQRVATSLHLLSADMAMARSSAIMRREQVVVCSGRPDSGCSDDHDWSAGWLVFRDPDGNRRPDASDDILRAADAPAGDARRLGDSTRPAALPGNGMAAHSNIASTLRARACGQSGGQRLGGCGRRVAQKIPPMSACLAVLTGRHRH